MSRIGKKPISVPAGVKIQINGRTINIEGAKGKLSMTHSAYVTVKWTESEKSITCTMDPKFAEVRQARADWGTTRALIQNMIQGASKGYEQKMEVVGVGWTAAVAGKQLKLVVGLASPILMDIPAGLNVSVEKSMVTISGADRQAVGQFAAEMRAKRKPEPYNGKGIKYVEEVIKRKQGKQFGS
jgi:large subunit ribosomal protein L6